MLDQFKSRALTQTAVAEALELDPAAISLTLTGERRPTLIEVQKLSGLLCVPALELLAKLGYPMELDTVPVRFYLRDDCTFADAPAPHLLVPAPPGITADACVFQVRSAAAPATWSRMLCFIPATLFPPTDVLGQFALVMTPQGDVLAGELSRGFEPGRYNLRHPATGHRVEDIEIDRAAAVTWMRPA